MKLYFIPIASVLLQFLSAFLALRLLWVTGRTASWIIIAGAILLMAFRRCISLYDWFFITVSPPPLDITFEIFGLCISALMAVGLLLISPLFHSIRRSVDLLKQQHRHILDSAGEGIFGLDLEGKVTLVNPAAVSLSGYQAEELLGRNSHDLLHYAKADGSPHLREECPIYATLKDAVVHRVVEDFFWRKDGQSFPVEYTATPTIENNRVIGTTVVFKDITARKKQQDELRQSEEHYRGLITNGSDMISILQAGGTMTYVSPSVMRILGYEPDEIIGKKACHLVHPKDVGNIRKLFDEAVKLEGSVYVSEYRMRHKDGSWRFFESMGKNLFSHKTISGVVINSRDITDRKMVEEALRQSEEKYRLVADFTYDWEYWTGPDGKLNYMSPSCERITGYRAEEFLANPELMNALAHPDDRGEVAEHTRQVMQNGTPAGHLEFRIITRSGEERWINHYCQSVYGSDGKWMGRRATNRDTTERKLAEVALRETNETLQAMFQASPVAINLIDVQGNVRIWSQAAEEMFGWSAAEVLGKPLPHIVPGQEENFRIMRDRALQGEPIIGTEVQRRRKDGSLIDISLSAAPVHNAQGNIIGALGLLMDISQRKQAEEAYKNLISHAPMGIFIVQDGKFVMINPWLESVTGYRAQERLGNDSLDLLVPECKALVREKVIRMLKGQDTDPFEFQFTTRSGEIRWAMEKVAPTQYEGKEAVLGYFMDITPLKTLEAQFLQAQKMEAIGRLAGGVAHDFNNMLAAIMGYAEMMLLGLSSEDPLHQQATAIIKASERASSLIRKLLAFSRKQVQQAQILNLNTVISGMNKMLHRLIGEDINLSVNLEPGIAAVMADPGQVEQILMNLVLNARDAILLGGRITIKTANVSLDEGYTRKHPYVIPGPYVAIAVSDSGTGMDAETQAHIFEPFFTTKEVGKGTGLGLSTVYGIVKQSQGSIEVYSEPGIGTTFKVYLPRVEADVVKARIEAPSNAGLDGTETILVVEDEELVRGSICESLKGYGYEVLEAINGHDALAVCEGHQGPIHLMLTDVVMPQISGRELAERLAPLRPDLKVLLMSGYMEDVIINQGMLEKTMHFIEKPFTANVLLRKVRELLGNTLKN